ncbi:MAG: molecular chaperone DnaJ [Pseudomonas sp.]
MSLVLFALLLGFIGWMWVRSQPSSQRWPAVIKLILGVTALVLLVLALTGRFYLVLGFLAAAVPILWRVLPGLLLGRAMRGMRGKGGGAAKPGNQSRVASLVLEMTLDHDSGEMQGEVLEGSFSGRSLADLGETEFIELLQYCRERDDDSARLLESYLDHRFGDSWREDDPAEDAGDTGEQAQSGTPLSEHDALEVLGLEPGASREDIIQAHRRLMQKVHPDRGGSTYLAARINEAKARLLG